MKRPTRFLLVPALLLCCGCVAAIGNRGAEGGQARGGEGKSGDDKDEADKLRKKERELGYARMELEIARLSAAAEEREAEMACVEAGQKLEATQRDRENFMTLDKPTQITGKQLELDRAQQRMKEAEEELKELETMYKQEDFAELTKELVLSRGRKNLEFSQRGLELARRGQEELTGHELPKKEKELAQAVEKAEKAVREANAKKERGAMEQKLKLTKSEHQIDELERELEKLKSKDKGKGEVAKAG